MPPVSTPVFRRPSGGTDAGEATAEGAKKAGEATAESADKAADTAAKGAKSVGKAITGKKDPKGKG